MLKEVKKSLKTPEAHQIIIENDRKSSFQSIIIDFDDVPHPSNIERDNENLDLNHISIALTDPDNNK